MYKPRKRLQPGDVYKSQPEIAVELLHQFREMGFEIERVLADSLYGESNSKFIAALEGDESSLFCGN
nr:hypothetical protein [Oscillatoria sp. PCC 10802]